MERKGRDFYPHLPERETQALKIYKDQHSRSRWRVSHVLFLLNQGGPVTIQPRKGRRNEWRGDKGAKERGRGEKAERKKEPVMGKLDRNTVFRELFRCCL